MSDVKISILGDICPTDDFKSFWENEKLVEVLSSSLKEFDFSLTNFECPATDIDTGIEKCGPCQKAKPSIIPTIRKTGISLISLANNHIKDFGEQGVLDTMKYCQHEGLAYVGAGSNKAEAAKPYFFEIKGKCFGILTFAEYEFNGASETSPGANIFDVYSSVEQIQDARRQCDFLLVLYHGGIEHYRYPSPELQKKCHMLVRLGANAVICQHSHCIGTYEYYQKGYILYGQGNAIFGYRENNPAWNEGLFLTLTVHDNELKVDYKLLKATQKGVCFANESEECKRLQQLTSDSEKLSNDKYIWKSWNEFCATQAALDLPLLVCWPLSMIRLNRLLKNRLFKWMTSRCARMATMNFIHCDALREVVTTLLEKDIWKKS